MDPKKNKPPCKCPPKSGIPVREQRGPQRRPRPTRRNAERDNVRPQQNALRRPLEPVQEYPQLLDRTAQETMTHIERAMNRSRMAQAETEAFEARRAALWSSYQNVSRPGQVGAERNYVAEEAENVPSYSQMPQQDFGDLAQGVDEDALVEDDVLDIQNKVSRRHVEDMSPPERYDRRRSLGLPSRPSYLRQNATCPGSRPLPEMEDNLQTVPAVRLIPCATPPPLNMPRRDPTRLAARERRLPRRKLHDRGEEPDPRTRNWN